MRVYWTSILVGLLALAAGRSEASEKAYMKAAEKLSAKAVSALAAKKIAVLPFEYLDGRASLGSRLIAEKLTNAFVEVGKLTVIERSMIDKVMKELKFESSGAIDAATAKELGKGLGVDAIVTGILDDSQDGKQTTFSARLIKTDTFEILGTDERDLDKTWTDPPAPAAAASSGGAKIKAFISACKGDLQQFCSQVPQGGGRQVRCLAKHTEDLSEGCGAYFAKKTNLQAGACSDEARRFCADVLPGGGRLVACLKTHADELSNACRARLKL